MLTVSKTNEASKGATPWRLYSPRLSFVGKLLIFVFFSGGGKYVKHAGFLGQGFGAVFDISRDSVDIPSLKCLTFSPDLKFKLAFKDEAGLLVGMTVVGDHGPGF